MCGGCSNIPDIFVARGCRFSDGEAADPTSSPECCIETEAWQDAQDLMRAAGMLSEEEEDKGRTKTGRKVSASKGAVEGSDPATLPGRPSGGGRGDRGRGRGGRGDRGRGRGGRGDRGRDKENIPEPAPKRKGAEPPPHKTNKRRMGLSDLNE